MKKNEHFITTIEDMSEDGAGVGKTDGFIWFIKDTVIGDVVEASAMKMKKSYGYARLVKVLTPSPYRVEPKCPVARQCGGCQLQMMDYKEQLRFKERKVYNHLKRIGGLENLVLPGEDEDCGNVAGLGASEAEMGGNVGGAWDAGRILRDFPGRWSGWSPLWGWRIPGVIGIRLSFHLDGARTEGSSPDFTRGGPTILWSARTVCWGWRRTA